MEAPRKKRGEAAQRLDTPGGRADYNHASPPGVLCCSGHAIPSRQRLSHTVPRVVLDNRAVEDRGLRIGQNEVLFREVNERLRELGEGFSIVAEQAEFICECGSSSCTEQIRMTLGEYEAVRTDAKRFFVVPGHEIPEYEKIVEEKEGYLVVEKLPGGPAGVAIRDDPRS
jgi:hypothetical protein